jgi:sulfoxide reductase heme-binding subunit YedZ
MGTAYAALLLLAASLAIGPVRVLRDQPNPVSTDLTRDVGIWAGVTSLLHVLFGIQVHMRGKFWLYFVYPPEQAHRLPLRHDSFGAANWTGLGATLVLVILLAISNDVSLRRLGARRWKALQRWSYAAALLTLAHGALFQVIEKRRLPWVLAFAAAAAVALLLQAAGFLTVRRGARTSG